MDGQLRFSQRRSMAGFTMIELMLALVISSLLMIGVVQIFMSSKTTYRVVDNLSRVQENGRFALDLLSRDVRMAGFLGCASKPARLTNTLNGSSAGLFNYAQAVEGFDDIPATLPTAVQALGLEHTPLAGTDVLLIRGVFSEPARVLHEDNNNSSQVFLEQRPSSTVTGGCPDGTNMYSGFCNADILLISDCSKSRIFQASNIQGSGGTKVNVVHSTSGNPGNSISSWGGNGSCKNGSAPPDECFGKGSEVFKLESRVFYVADPDGTGPLSPNLYVKRNNTVNDSAIIDNIEDFQLLYGVDGDSSALGDRAESYETATAVAGEWNRVVSVRLSLLLRTAEDRLAVETQPYVFDGTVSSPSDLRLRRTFTSLVTLRNRALE